MPDSTSVCQAWSFPLVDAGFGSRVQQRQQRIAFSAYVEALAAAFGHADRAKPYRSNCTTLLRRPAPPPAVVLTDAGYGVELCLDTGELHRCHQNAGAALAVHLR